MWVDHLWLEKRESIFVLHPQPNLFFGSSRNGWLPDAWMLHQRTWLAASSIVPGRAHYTKQSTWVQNPLAFTSVGQFSETWTEPPQLSHQFLRFISTVLKKEKKRKKVVIYNHNCKKMKELVLIYNHSSQKNYTTFSITSSLSFWNNQNWTLPGSGFFPSWKNQNWQPSDAEILQKPELNITNKIKIPTRHCYLPAVSNPTLVVINVVKSVIRCHFYASNKIAQTVILIHWKVPKFRLHLAWG